MSQSTKTDRSIPLYTRLSPKNDAFLRTVSKKFGMSKTAWIDAHFSFLRNNIDMDKMEHSRGKKARNRLQNEGRSSS